MILIFQIDKELASGEYFLKTKERLQMKHAEKKVRLSIISGREVCWRQKSGKVF